MLYYLTKMIKIACRLLLILVASFRIHGLQPVLGKPAVNHRESRIWLWKSLKRSSADGDNQIVTNEALAEPASLEVVMDQSQNSTDSSDTSTSKKSKRFRLLKRFRGSALSPPTQQIETQSEKDDSFVSSANLASEHEKEYPNESKPEIFESQNQPAPSSTSEDNPQKEPTASINVDGIQVSSEIDLPFSVETAFTAYSDLQRQSTWSDWLTSVEYISEEESLWKMNFFGFRYSWKSATVNLIPPHVMEWESTSGLRNFGRVDLRATSENSSHMKVTMTLQPPRVVRRFTATGRGDNPACRLVENRMLKPSLENFRDIVAKETKAAENEKATEHQR